MSTERAKALQLLWKDRCTVIQRIEKTDPETHLTDWVEETILTDEPCKLSFESLSTADGDPVATVAQSVKLFLRHDVDIPAGCKIIVERADRTVVYASSGVPGVFTHHQEISLKLFRGWV